MNITMNVLGIETSCDETSAAIVSNGKEVLSNIISSSIKFHKKYGGVIPEIASRMQLETIAQVTDQCIKESGISRKDLGLISVTSGPGLLGSLLVGISFAKALSFGLGLPIIGVNHLYAHIYASFLNHKSLSLPFIALIVSGGHTSLFLVEDFDKIKLLGQTQDDACGEAFDKAAKILGLGYPGGPVIEKLSYKGNPGKIKFNCSDTKKPLNFSFSGIKTAVLYYVKKSTVHSPQTTDKIKYYGLSTMDHRLISDIAASFQEAVIDTLINKSLLACRMKKINKLVVGGGVAANNRLREKLFEKAKRGNIKVYFPEKILCMDNAAMIAGLGYQLFKKGYSSGMDLDIDNT
ncbi:MAG: tRNA (adenosine(37)-N6)-threonylcarbamoyltransferase complex transferase subunit TsaD [Candidatus Omnitrophota bacterium]